MIMSLIAKYSRLCSGLNRDNLNLDSPWRTRQMCEHCHDTEVVKHSFWQQLVASWKNVFAKIRQTPEPIFRPDCKSDLEQILDLPNEYDRRR